MTRKIAALFALLVGAFLAGGINAETMAIPCPDGSTATFDYDYDNFVEYETYTLDGRPGSSDWQPRPLIVCPNGLILWGPPEWQEGNGLARSLEIIARPEYQAYIDAGHPHLALLYYAEAMDLNDLLLLDVLAPAMWSVTENRSEYERVNRKLIEITVPLIPRLRNSMFAYLIDSLSIQTANAYRVIGDFEQAAHWLDMMTFEDPFPEEQRSRVERLRAAIDQQCSEIEPTDECEAGSVY